MKSLQKHMTASYYAIELLPSLMADVFGFGSQRFPIVPYFGVYQMMGVMLGELVVAAGLLLLIPFHPPKSD